jgi:hypothetical protein
LGRAHSEGRILVTLDKDFGELIIVHRMPHSGILRVVDIAARKQTGDERSPRSIPYTVDTVSGLRRAGLAVCSGSANAPGSPGRPCSDDHRGYDRTLAARS